MKIGYYQFNPKLKDTSFNINKVLDNLSNIETTDIIVLPELFTSGYTLLSRNELAELSLDINDEWIFPLQKISNEKKMYIYGGFPEKYGEKIFNSAFLICPNKEIIIYRKAHLFEDEKDIFDKSYDKLCIHNITLANGEEVNIGLMICFDWIFPEMLRSLSLLGAQVILHCANLVLPYCPNAMITRCIENRVFAVTCNRNGEEINGNKRNKFIGMSQVVDCKGNILYRSAENVEEVKIIEINHKEANDKIVATKNNIFEDRRTDLYLDK